MKVSIITVCFNSAATIRDTIESVLSQSYPDIEYIVIDGGSRDETMAIVSEYSGQIAKIVSEPDKGIYDAMNKGVRYSTGDIVGILNSDDFYESTRAVEEIVSCFHAEPSPDIVFGDVVFVEPDNLKKIVRYYSSKQFRPWKLRFGWMPPHPATFIRKEAYASIGDYSLSYRISADYEMFVRLLLVARLRWKRVDRVVVRMRAGGISTAGLSSTIRLNREIVRACRENGVYTNLAMVLSKMPIKLLEMVRRPKDSV
jgi:glycosyltransferase involved in cell wall biosynthesis